jgi:hypothetical protein
MAFPSLGCCPAFQSLPGLGLVGKDLDLLLPFDPTKPQLRTKQIVPNRSRSIIRLKKRALPCSGSRR